MQLNKTQPPVPGNRKHPYVTVTVELFGNARLIAKRSMLKIDLLSEIAADDVARSLAKIQPELVGEIIEPDGTLMSSYTINLNGVLFISDVRVSIKDGDRILLFSSQAGG